MFCFPISDHVQEPNRLLPRDATRGDATQMSSYARANVRITNVTNKRKIPMRVSRGLKWENKMYTLFEVI